MKLTQNHVLFWQSKQHRPEWVLDLEDSEDTRLHRMRFIHQCINDHDERYSAHLFAYRHRYMQANNTIALLKMVRRRRESLEAHLRMWARSTDANSPHRENARRWLRRLLRAESKVKLTPAGTEAR